MINKIVPSLAEAVADIPDGAKVMVSGIWRGWLADPIAGCPG